MNRFCRQTVSLLVVFSMVFTPGFAFAHGPGTYPSDVGLKSVQKMALPDPGNFVNFETPHVHPLDINADNTLLAAVNTADARVELYAIDGSGALTHINSIPVGVDPVTARFRTNTELWVVNHISDSVSIVDTTAGNVTSIINTDDEPADVVFFTDAGNSDPLAAVTCSRVDTVEIYHATTLALVDTFPVLGEDPRGLATDGTDVYGAVFYSGNSTTIIGHDVSSLNTRLALDDATNPYGGLGVGAPNQPYNNGVPGTAWVTPHGSVDAAGLASASKPPAIVSSLIVRKDYDDGNKWKDDNGADWTSWITGANATKSERLPGWDMIDNDIFSISTTSGTTSLDASFGASGYVINRMNICMAIGLNPVDGSVVMVGTEATNEIRFEPVINGSFVRTRVAIANPSTGAEIALVDMNEEHLDAAQSGAGTAYEDESVLQADRDKSIGDPRGIAFHHTTGNIYVTGMGSNNVIVLDKATGERLGGVGHTIEVGTGPTGARHHGTLDRLYVQNKFSADISVIDTSTVGSETVVQTIDYYDPTPSWVNDGRVHMYDTHASSGLGQVACASCHVDSTMDRLAWDLGDPLGNMKDTVLVDLVTPAAGEHNLSFTAESAFDDFHFMKGPMTTQTLQDIIGKEPLHWRGDRDGIEEFAGAFSGLQGDDAPLGASDMQDFENFLSTIHFPPNDFRALDNSLPGGPKFFGAGTNPKLPLPNHFTSGRFAAEGSPLPDGDAWRGFNLYVDGDPDHVDGDPELDGSFHCVTCHALPMGAGSIDFFNGATFVDIPAGPLGEAHQLMVSVDGTGEKAFKVAPTRNQMDKVGFFMAANPLDSGNPHLSRAGFGVLHDGSVPGVDTFLASPVFDVQSDQDVADLVAFTLCMNGSDFENLISLAGSPTGFPAGVAGTRPPGPDGGEARTAHAAVGKQLSLASSTLSTPDQDLLDLMIDMADAENVDLIVKGPDGSGTLGWVWDATTDMFIADDGTSISEAALVALAGSGTELTFTTVPTGLGTRMGIDRDEDGVFDGIEADAGTDPANPGSKLAYVDFAHAGTENGLVSTPFNTLAEAIDSMDSGIIRLNGDSATLTSTETFTSGNGINKPIIIQTVGANSVRIGVATKGVVILKEGDQKTTLQDDDGASNAAEEDFSWFLSMIAKNFGQSDSDGDGSNSKGAEIRDGEVHAKVLPYTRSTSGARILEPGMPIALRLRGDAEIDPQSLWGAPEGTHLITQPSEEDMRDVWVLVAPNENRHFAGLIDMTVGGTTASGAGVTSDSGAFLADPYAERADVPGLPDIGVDGPLGIFPETVYEEPQRIWLPIPDGTMANQVQLYYFHADGEERGWYPAENVEGWLVPDSYSVIRQGDTNYLGFLVRHAGIVQLGTK